jgi:hypothetical protein
MAETSVITFTVSKSFKKKVTEHAQYLSAASQKRITVADVARDALVRHMKQVLEVSPPPATEESRRSVRRIRRENVE